MVSATAQIFRHVALLTEGVDRNWHYADNYNEVPTVALLTEGVDRNGVVMRMIALVFTVALLTEGVDRNEERKLYTNIEAKSPSSRRAWIEMHV